MKKPDVSIIVVIGNKRKRAETCFKKILNQENIDRAELVIVDANTIGAPKILIDKKDVVYLQMAREAIGDLKYSALKAAKGYWVSFVEEHVRVHDGWLNSILDIDKVKYKGMSGEIHNANPDEKLSNILHYCNYYRWLPPTTRRDAKLMVGHNATYSREAVLSFGDRVPILIQNEILLLNELTRQGGKFLIDPNNRISHINESSFSEITNSYFYWHACLGTSILIEERPNLLKRIFQSLLNLLRPFSRTAKILLFLIRNQPERLLSFLSFSPVIFYTYGCACLGISYGLLFPSEQQGLMLAKMELDAERTKNENL